MSAFICKVSSYKIEAAGKLSHMISVENKGRWRRELEGREQ